jgi:urease accessory protein UreH
MKPSLLKHAALVLGIASSLLLQACGGGGGGGERQSNAANAAARCDLHLERDGATRFRRRCGQRCQ